MTIQAYPSINDVEPSWADISATFTITGGDLLDTVDFASIKWSRKVDVGVRRGPNGGRIMARTTGEGSQDASSILYRSGLRRLIKSLMAVAPTRGNQRRISLVSFDILIQHTPPGEIEIYTTKLKGCRYLGDADDMKEGPDADKIEVTLNPIEIVNIIDGQEVVLL
ncbi:MAG: hypothetical protein FWD69_10505 [Polyangiaceae bacterium]|nr:hypothetical protein [Polyangiaceae bacterium]